MIQVTVEFHGICTHFLRDVHSQLPVPHRVVLMKTESGTEVRTIPIGLHDPTLRLNGTTFALEGVRLSLETASETAPAYQRLDSFDNLPNLTALMNNVETLSPPSPFVFQDFASEAACFFDIFFGTMSGAISELDAAFAILVAQSDEDCILKATPFPGASLPAGLSAETTISQDTTIIVANADHVDVKTAADFLLHYKTAEHIPMVPQIPQPVTLQATLPRQVSRAQILTIGAGCSNSNYP